MLLIEAKCHARFLFRFCRLLLTTRHWPDDPDFLREAYCVYLRRLPDEDGLTHYGQALAAGRTDRLHVIGALRRSIEFVPAQTLPVRLEVAVHHARLLLVRECLPAADAIVDLGGAAKEDRGGALLFMGYPHRPRQITIYDLPGSEASRRWQSEPQPYVTANGTSVRYCFGSMTDLSGVDDASVDMVWSGQSIEHVSPADADRVCQEAYRALRPGGRFCLDTPNGPIMRLLSRDKLTHPHHKVEYAPEELEAKLERWGFRVVASKAICPMPESRRRGTFIYKELLSNSCLSDDAADGYAFYLEAVKPGPATA